MPLKVIEKIKKFGKSFEVLTLDTVKGFLQVLNFKSARLCHFCFLDLNISPKTSLLMLVNTGRFELLSFLTLIKKCSP